MSNRRIRVEAAFGFGPFDTVTSTDWVPLTRTDPGNIGVTRALEATWEIGRTNELDPFDAGTARVLLWNRDRALDPDHASSPYAGELLPNVPVRIRSQQAPWSVTAIGRSSGTVVMTIDISSAPAPATGTTIVVDVALAGFDGTFTCGGLFLGLPNIIVYSQAGADVGSTPTSGTVTEVSDEFYGYVRGGWEQQLAPAGTGDCHIELTDLLGVISGYTLTDVFHQKILDHNPVGFWVLDGGMVDDAEQVADRGSGETDGVLIGEGVTLGDRVISPGHHPAARFDIAIDETTNKFTAGAVYLGRSPVVTTTLSDALLVATFQTRSEADDDRRVLFVQAFGTNVDRWPIGNGIEAHVHTDGRLIYGNGTVLSGASPRTVVDGRSHIVFANNESLGVDTATLSGSGSVAKSIATVNGAGIGGAKGLRTTRCWDGWIGCVALFASSATVGTAGRDAILTAYTKLSGQRSDQHITWALDELGIPAGLRNLAVGSVIMGPADTEDKDALTFMREVAATEGGGLYVDHRDGGKIRFTNRYQRFLQARSTTSQAAFSDNPTAAGVIRYSPAGLEVAPNSLDGIVNQVAASWTGGTVTVQDDTSVATYGPRNRQIDTVATTASQARSAAEWMLVRYKDPRSRIRGCVATDRLMRTRNDLVQHLRIDDRATFRLHPLKVGAATTVNLFIDGISHSAVGVEWETSFRFAPVDTFTPWIWGTGAWGTTAYWG